MRAIEFETRIKDNTITIPRNISNVGGQKIKVILLYEEKAQTPKSLQPKVIQKFSKIKLKTKSYKFNREAANER